MPQLPHQALTPYRRVAAEVLAAVVQKLFPNAKLLGGETTSWGFFYDFIFDQPFLPSLLDIVEMKMRTLIKEGQEIYPQTMMRENAATMFLHYHQPLLADLIDHQPDALVNIVRIGDFYGFCPEPPIKSTSDLGQIKLLQIEEFSVPDPKGKKTQLITRIRGTLFFDQKELKTFVKALNQSKKRDLLQMGEAKHLFYLDPSCSELELFWLPKGKQLLGSIEKFWEKERRKREIQLIQTPQVVNESFVQDSNGCFFLETDDPIEILNRTKLDQHLHLSSKLKIAQIRWAELATFYQKISEWEFDPLFSPYCYQSDCFTLICLEKEVVGEIISSLQFFKEVARIFSLDSSWCFYSAETDRMKEKTDSKMKAWCQQALKACEITEYSESTSLGYPKIELQWIDALGRTWSGPYIEILQNKDRFVLHGSLLGPFNRLIALLLENESLVEEKIGQLES